MAILNTEPTTYENRILINDMPPKGTHVAVCIENEDFLNTERLKYGTSNELETVNLTRFYFGFFKTGKPYIVRTRLYRISLHEKSALLPFLTAWTGEQPAAGFDTNTLVGRATQVTVTHTVASNGKTYANISAIAPLMEGLEDKVPDPAAFAAYMGPYAALPPVRLEGLASSAFPPGPAGPSGMPKQSVSMDDLAGPAPASIRQRLPAAQLDDDDEIPF